MLGLRIFLCHASEDQRPVRDLCRRLRADGFDPWLDQERLLPGQDWEHEIVAAVRASDIVIVCLSSTSVSKVGYVQKELRRVLDVADRQPEGRIFVIPVRLEACAVPDRLSQWQYADIFVEGGYERLRASLNARAGGVDTAPVLPLPPLAGGQIIPPAHVSSRHRRPPAWEPLTASGAKQRTLPQLQGADEITGPPLSKKRTVWRRIVPFAGVLLALLVILVLTEARHWLTEMRKASKTNVDKANEYALAAKCEEQLKSAVKIAPDFEYRFRLDGLLRPASLNAKVDAVGELVANLSRTVNGLRFDACPQNLVDSVEEWRSRLSELSKTLTSHPPIPEGNAANVAKLFNFDSKSDFSGSNGDVNTWLRMLKGQILDTGQAFAGIGIDDVNDIGSSDFKTDWDIKIAKAIEDAKKAKCEEQINSAVKMIPDFERRFRLDGLLRPASLNAKVNAIARLVANLSGTVNNLEFDACPQNLIDSVDRWRLRLSGVSRTLTSHPVIPEGNAANVAKLFNFDSKSDFSGSNGDVNTWLRMLNGQLLNTGQAFDEIGNISTVKDSSGFKRPCLYPRCDGSDERNLPVLR
jgi:hypothetical protein